MTDQDKQARLAAALRENLRKRKQGAPRPGAPAKALGPDDDAPDD